MVNTVQVLEVGVNDIIMLDKDEMLEEKPA